MVRYDTYCDTGMTIRYVSRYIYYPLIYEMQNYVTEVPIRIYYNIWGNTYHDTIFSLAIRIVGAAYRYIVIHRWIVMSLVISPVHPYICLHCVFVRTYNFTGIPSLYSPVVRINEVNKKHHWITENANPHFRQQYIIWINIRAQTLGPISNMSWSMGVNTKHLHADFFLWNIKICLQFLWSFQWVNARKMPGHQQPWYWPIFHGIFQPQHQKG